MASSSLRKIRFLQTKQIQQLVFTNVADSSLLQPELLDSAANSPLNVKHYSQEQNLFRLAANLSEKIAKNHPFQDGNKRAAMVAADAFLKINGYQLQEVPFKDVKTNDILARAHKAIVTNEWTTEQLAQCYESIATRVQTTSEVIERLRAGAIEF